MVGGDQFTADYPHYLRAHLKARYGAETPVVFLLGACGDITQVDNRSTAVEFGPEHADMMGQKLAAGTYSLHTLPGRDEWTIIFNSDAGQWGSFTYDEKKDTLRVKAKPQMVAENEELAGTVMR